MCKFISFSSDLIPSNANQADVSVRNFCSMDMYAYADEIFVEK